MLGITDLRSSDLPRAVEARDLRAEGTPPREPLFNGRPVLPNPALRYKPVSSRLSPEGAPACQFLRS
jgi:hypothetical protein